MDCSYWVHAMYMAFPDAEEKVLENITFRCLTHNRENEAAVNSKKEEHINSMEGITCKIKSLT